MYRFYLNGINNEYNFEELAREFLTDEDFEVIPVVFRRGEDVCLTDKSYVLNRIGDMDTESIKAEMYRILSSRTGISPEWGTLTGVRPLKLAMKHLAQTGTVDGTIRILEDRYLVHPDKSRLLRDIMTYQLRHMKPPTPKSCGIYVHIPFCPTRCSYCSFATHIGTPADISEYLTYLIREIRITSKLMKELDYIPESVYIGGGTPTVLSADEMEILVRELTASFETDPAAIEFTVEAGRPDTIDRRKLQILREYGIERISINPQSMNDETLKRIGRSHSPRDIQNAFYLAKDAGFPVINSDIIAGLPGESPDQFARTLREVYALGANNITVHTLSVKRGSALRETDPGLYRTNAENVRRMLAYSRQFMDDHNYFPYYMYRQKHQTGFLENVGYCREGTHSVYNIRIMEEKQTIFGAGAGAIGKAYNPEEDRLERVPNVGNYRIYEERFDEMMRRKGKYNICSGI